MMTRSKARPPEAGSGDRRPTRAPRWRDRASILALIAGFVSVAILVVEGPPGSGYGWGSVVISAGVVAGLFIAMSYLVRSDSSGRALAAAAVAVLVVVMFGASLIGMSMARLRSPLVAN
jgi:hypothetical protein